MTAGDVETGELVLYSQFDNFYFSYEDWIDDWFYLDEPQKENKKCLSLWAENAFWLTNH